MAKKDEQNRLLIPSDIWNSVGFDDYTSQNFAFYIANDRRVVITSLELAEQFEYEFIGSCKIDQKHRFVLPENVDEFLGYGDTYYFSTSTSQSLIYIQKTNSIYIQNVKSLVSSIRGLLEGLDSYLKEDIDD